MSKLHFCYFMDYEEGKMARVKTREHDEIPINIFIDNAADFGKVQECSCSIEIYGIGSDVKIFASEAEYWTADTKMDTISLIPVGTFPSNPDDKNFEQSPHILFTGKVLDVEWNLKAEQNEPNCCIHIKTLELAFYLYTRYNASVEKGFIVHGDAWLFGNMKLADDD